MQTSQQVSGLYLGSIPFRGVITEMRRLTVKTDCCFEYMIDLLEPVTVYGEQRSNLVVFAQFDGAPSSYTKFTDSLVAV